MHGISLPSASQAGLPPGGSTSSSAPSSRREPQLSWGGRPSSDCPHQQGSIYSWGRNPARSCLGNCLLGTFRLSRGCLSQNLIWVGSSLALASTEVLQPTPPVVERMAEPHLSISWICFSAGSKLRMRGYVGRICQPLLSSVVTRTPP